MEYQKLIIKGISYSQNQSGAYALLLEHEPSKVKLPIVIGAFEAQAITLGLEKDLKPMRPLTHDLFGNFIESTNYNLESIVIYQILEGVFFSNLHFKDKTTEEELILDARTSDAVAMAVRFSTPIYTTKNVLEEAGILLEEHNEIYDEDDADANTDDVEVDDDDLIFVEDELPFKDSLKILSNQELTSLLEQAVLDEDFDVALEIQEEIKRRDKE